MNDRSGREPLNALWSSSRNVRRVEAAMSGSSLVNLLFDRVIRRSCGMLVNDGGRLPASELFENSLRGRGRRNNSATDV